jgi:hypothetical protein
MKKKFVFFANHIKNCLNFNDIFEKNLNFYFKLVILAAKVRRSNNTALTVQRHVKSMILFNNSPRRIKTHAAM